MTRLSEFIQTERALYADNDNNLFAFSLSQALRYYEFLVIIANRYKKVSIKRVANLQKFMSSVQSVGKMTGKETRLYKEMLQLDPLVHLEIESFYLFAKIFLDKVALFLQDYFGQARGISLRSHDKLTKYQEQYRTLKQLVYPKGFSESLQLLKEHICDYRDKQISHLQNPKATKGTSFKPGGKIQMFVAPLFPNQNELDAQVESKELTELLIDIDTYIQLTINVIELNRNQTRFRLKANH
jgi:hypothetical protein